MKEMWNAILVIRNFIIYAFTLPFLYQGFLIKGLKYKHNRLNICIRCS
jgi:hypothetical protein